MKAIIFEEVGKATYGDFPDPHSSPERILVETLYSGLSWGTENAWLEGKYPHGFRFPGISGYLSVGRVLHVGEKTGRPDVQEGDLVYAGGYHAQRIDQVPIVIQPLPPGIDLAAASFVHFAAIGLHGLNRSGCQAGEALYVHGQGLLGQMTAQAGRALGMNVVAANLSPTRVEQSRTVSCQDAFEARDPALKRRLDELGGPDVIVNSTGVSGLEDELIASLKPGGRLVLQGMTPRVSFDYWPAHTRQITVVFPADSGRDEDLQCIEWLHEKKIQIAPLITHRLSPQEMVKLYGTRPAENMLGVVADWSQS
jgi:2-desacetyl-2-hydroxyethyl bacteriochlorophyllide A dehydrogenase